MRVAIHQLIFLPWPGLFFKAMMADCLVLLDDIQFPRGRSWVNRNRVKNEQGELWLTAPVKRKGRSLQQISEVEFFEETDWRRKHLRSIRQSYARAPYLVDYLPGISEVYESGYEKLSSLNFELICYLCNALGLKNRVVLQSDLKVTGHGTDLIVSICRKLRASDYFTFRVSLKHLDLAKFNRAGVDIVAHSFQSPVYPQLWGDFIANLSVLDLLMNCGRKASSVLRNQQSLNRQNV